MKLQQTRRGSFLFSEAATRSLHIFYFLASDKTDGSEFNFKSKYWSIFNMLTEQSHSRDNNNNNNKSKKKLTTCALQRAD